MAMKFLTVLPKSATDVKWKMKDGTMIAVCDMEEHHAKSALRLMIQKYTSLEDPVPVAGPDVGDGDNLPTTFHTNKPPWA